MAPSFLASLACTGFGGVAGFGPAVFFAACFCAAGFAAGFASAFGSGFAAISDRHALLLAFLAAHRLACLVGGNGCDQGRAGALRSGIDDHRFGGRGCQGQHFGWFHRTGCSSRREQREAGIATLAGIVAAGCKRDVVVVGYGNARALAFWPAHVIAQVRRLGGDRFHRRERAQRRLQPRQAGGLAEAAFEQLRGLRGADRRRRRAEHDSDHPLAVTAGGGDEVEAGGADEAGLHAVGTGIAADQAVEVAGDLAAEADRRDVGEVLILGQVANDRAREHCHVARRRDLSLRRQSVRIDVARLRHADPQRVPVHLVGEFLD